jgi:hypothetical protein
LNRRTSTFIFISKTVITIFEIHQKHLNIVI